MNRSAGTNRRAPRFQPAGEGLEGRQLLSQGGLVSLSRAEVSALQHNPPGYPVVRPNTPVLPYGTPSKQASFVDPSARVFNGNLVLVGWRSLIAPYSTLDARGGAIKVGVGSAVLDNAVIVANPQRMHPGTVVRIGDQVSIGYGAKVHGPSTIGGYNADGKPTEIGPGAVIDGATIQPGAFVSALARVGPGVTVPTGYRVLAGKNVTTDAEASDPALGKVVPVTAADQAEIAQTLSRNKALAAGYVTLYQGNSATGATPGIDPTVKGVYNGNLATVLGASPQPGPANVPFEPSSTGPKFPSPHRGEVEGLLNTFPARVVGGAVFRTRARRVAHGLGRSNSIRADQGQPITFASISRTGFGVTVNSPLDGQLTIGQNFLAASGAVILGGPGVNAKLGDNVTIGSGAVVDRSSLGSGSTVGDRAYVLNSTFPAGTNIPAGAIYINNLLVGSVEW